jgi:hypothetical protein
MEAMCIPTMLNLTYEVMLYLNANQIDQYFSMNQTIRGRNNKLG